MLYNEFLQGTGCKNTPYNFGVFSALNSLYMENDQMTKADVYEAGKRLVDNSKTPEEIKQEDEIKALIASYKGAREEAKDRHARYSAYVDIETNPEWLKTWKQARKQAREDVREFTAKIKALEWVLK